MSRQLLSSSRFKIPVIFAVYLIAVTLLYLCAEWLNTTLNNRYPEHSSLISLLKTVSFLVSTSFIMYLSARHWQELFIASERREAKQRRQLKLLDQFRENVIDNALIWINVLDPKGRITVWNKAAEQISGYSRNEVQGDSQIWEWLYPDPECRTEIGNKVMEILEKGVEVVGFETRIRTKVGEEKVIAWNSRRFFNENGEMMGSIAIGQDITSHKLLEMELKRLATHDSLTGLYNRHELMRRLDEDFSRSERYQHPLSILMIDIDYFKQINDQYGHQAGDAVLSRFGSLLSEAIRVVDYAGRYGGEEFLVVLPETHFDMALEIAERLRSKIESEDWSQNVGKSEKITISVGVVSYPEVMGSADQLVLVADQALYQAKNTGRNRVCTPS